MEVQLRSPKEIMKLSRLGCFHQSKLSFLRSFLEEFKDWKYSRDLFELNKEGYGRAVYSFSKNNRTYSLVCFANKLKDDERSDRFLKNPIFICKHIFYKFPKKVIKKLSGLKLFLLELHFDRAY